MPPQLPIQFESSVRGWIDGLSPEVAHLLACRAVLRTFPFLLSENVRNQGLVDIPTLCESLRIVISQVTTAARTGFEYNPMGLPIDVVHLNLLSPTFREAIYGVLNLSSLSRKSGKPNPSAYHTVMASAHVSAYLTVTDYGNEGGMHHDSIQQVLGESISDEEVGLDSVLEAKLWRTAPTWALEGQRIMRTVWAPSTPGGEFWMRWYQGFLDGNPLPWDLQRDIALIPDEDWKKGEAHIARLIEVIEERHRLLALVADLKKSLAEATAASTAVATPEQRNHNQPPELIDAPVQLREAITVIRIALDEAETELAKPDPAPSTLRRIAVTLADAVKAAAYWCGDKLDVLVTEAAKEAGKALGGWGVKALIATMTVAAATGPMQSLIKGLADLASRLPP